MAKNPFGFKNYKRLPKDWNKRGKLFIAEYSLVRYVEMEDDEFNRKTFEDTPYISKFHFVILNNKPELARK